MTSIAEADVEQVALAWMESIGWTNGNGAEIAPRELAAERSDYSQVELEQGHRPGSRGQQRLAGRHWVASVSGKSCQMDCGEIA